MSSNVNKVTHVYIKSRDLFELFECLTFYKVWCNVLGMSASSEMWLGPDSEYGERPTKPGVYEWYDEHGNVRLVDVVNVWERCGANKQWLRVIWWGGYYDVTPDTDGIPGNDWPNRWGRFMGERKHYAESQLFLQPDGLTI